MKMSDSKSTTLILVLLLAFAAIMANCAREVQSVDIINQIPEPVFVQCKSANDNLGPHTLNYGQDYFWSFHSDVWGTTLYHCDFHWGTRYQGFPVWQDIGIWGHGHKYCRHCEWFVRPDGFYRAEQGGPQTFVSPWLY